MKRIFLLFTFLSVSSLLWAEVTLTVSTDKTDLMLDDELTLTVKVTGASGTMVMPQLPSLPAFNVYSQGAESISVNGKSTFIFRYTMMPRFVGNATIGEVTFKYGGKIYKTKPISVRIYRNDTTAAQVAVANAQNAHTATSTTRGTNTVPNAGTQLPPLEKELATRAYAHTSEPYFIVSAVSNKTPYVNEPIELGVRFYFSQAFYDASFHAPTVSNLFIKEVSSTQGQQTLNNRPYRYEEKRYQISGVDAGKAEIIGIMVKLREGDSPLSLLDRFFGGAAVQPERTITAVPMKLTIKPLPVKNMPQSFYGAVGSHYIFSAKLDRSTVPVGEAVTWSATVQGDGNLKTTTDLNFPQIKGLSSYPAAPLADALPNSTNRSYKVFKTELVPAYSSTYTLPALQWSYFDPQLNTYKTLTSVPLTLTVTPSTHTASQVDFGANPVAETGIEKIGQDIRYLITTTTDTPSWLVHLADWKILHLVAFLWLAGCIFIASIGKKTAAKKRAYAHAKSQFKKATTYEDISDTLATYLMDKWHISCASLPLKSILQELQKHKVDPATLEEFATLWKELESARFAPLQATTQTRDQFINRILLLLKKLEEGK